MNAPACIFATIDYLKVGAADVFYSYKIVSDEPDQSYTAWHLRETIPTEGTQFANITRLYLQDSRHLQALDCLESFPNLEMLWVYGSDKLSNIEGIEIAKKLKSLTVWPSFSSNITLDSLAPVAALDDLIEFNFSGKTRDGSLNHLQRLQQLSTVFFSNSYSWEEIARFEASHPEIDFPWKGGVVYNANPSVLKCKKCEAPQAMLSGKGLKLSCPQCDAAYLKKHLERNSKVSAA